MDPQARSTRLGKALIATAYLGIAVTVAHSVEAQDSFALERDDGYSPLTRNDVIELQEVLTRFGYDLGPVDGVVGPQTAAAAKGLAGTLEREFVRRPSGQEIVLDCKIEGGSRGWDSTQIMIDEHRGIVIYGFHLPANRGSYNPIHRVGEGSGRGYIDLSMKISMNNDNFIMANDTSAAIIIDKHDGRFVKSFVTLIPLTNGSWFADGNTLEGKCTKSPFE